MGFCYVNDPVNGLVWKDQEYHAAWRKNTGWANVFSTTIFAGEAHQHKSMYEYEGVPKAQIDATGYSVHELARIEYAFESVRLKGKPDEHMFNGIMAVVDVLAEIHGIDLTEKETAKGLFVKVPL